MNIDFVPYIVIAIIIVQIYFFVQNLRRMKEFKEIFSKEDTWGIDYDDKDWVVGILGEGNGIFTAIKLSINKYLGHNSGSVIDFNLLKDAVDRHSDSVENDISTLTPVPLYCGLAGTMVGVIIGLGALLSTGSITELLSSGSSNFVNAALGVNNLLSGVAWAMVASIVGILLTTASSILFKKNKLIGEAGKNSFLAWLQSRLLPELPTDTSDALNRLVKNLNKFNNTFANNTSELKTTLSSVNQSYQIQADIIQAVHDMDVMKMATANVKVLKDLQECTDQLERFNEYLNTVNGYTERIHQFEQMFDDESERLHVLEEIRDFFVRHKAEIAKTTSDADNTLKGALRSIEESTTEETKKLNKLMVEQAEIFKSIVQEQKNSFVEINKDIQSQFNNELGKIPMLERKLSEISNIPERLDKLADKIENSNTKMLGQMSRIYEKTGNNISDDFNLSESKFGMPKWMCLIIIVGVILIAISCITNTIYNMFGEDDAIKQIEQKIEDTNTRIYNLNEKIETKQDVSSNDSTIFNINK